MKYLCQGTDCHTYETHSRVRGQKGNKVLRTRNARYNIEGDKSPWFRQWEYYFCDERCMNDWLEKHLTQVMTVVGIKTKAQETPVKIVETVHQDWQGQDYTRTTIEKLT